MGPWGFLRYTHDFQRFSMKGGNDHPQYKDLVDIPRLQASYAAKVGESKADDVT